MPKETLVAGSFLLKQVEHHQKQAKKMILAKEFVRTAAYNIDKNLKYHLRKKKNLEKPIAEIDNWVAKIEAAENRESLMGIEGNIRKIYYSKKAS